MFRTLSEMQKGATFYAITLGLAVLLALFGPTGSEAIQTINMFTATAGVLLMLLGGHARWVSQGGLGAARFAPRRLSVLASCLARTNGCPGRVVRRCDSAGCGVLAIRIRHREQSRHQYCDHLVLRVL